VKLNLKPTSREENLYLAFEYVLTNYRRHFLFGFSFFKGRSGSGASK
jgi:hypothetical protein